MATTSLRAVTTRIPPPAALETSTARNLRTVQGMVDGFAAQDIKGVMALMADGAVYCDILGDGVRGVEYSGKAAIREAFSRQFELAGRHTYVDARIMAEEDLGFASWTMVLGDPDDIKAARFEGIDLFVFDGEGPAPAAA